MGPNAEKTCPILIQDPKQDKNITHTDALAYNVLGIYVYECDLIQG